MTPSAALPEPALAFSFLGYPLRLADPGALWLLLAVPVLALLGALALVRRRRALLRAAGALAPRVAPAANASRPAARLGLSLLGLALLAVALSRPQCGSRTELAKQYGVDLAVVLDASRSMLADDVKPDRLSRAKLELAALLDGLAGDRVGLVAFAGEALVACPLTSDHAAAKLFLRAVEPDALPRQGTALAQALAAARDVLLASESPGRARVVLVVSDGEDHGGGVASAAQALAQDGIRLFALAVGTERGAPVPPRADGRGRKPREPVVTRLDLVSLRLLAGTGNGDVYDVLSRDHGLAAFESELDRMARAEDEGRVTVTYEDRYALAAFPGFLLLLASLLVREARGTRRAPPLPARPGGGAAASGPSGRVAVLALLAVLLPGFSPFQAEEEHVRAGNERLLAGDAAGALRAYDEAERAVGRRPEIEFDRGNAAAHEGRLDDAQAAFGRAAATAPAPLASRALQNLGNALAAAGDGEGAVRAFSDALARDPSNEDARWNLEVLLRKRGEPPEPPPSPRPSRGEEDRELARGGKGEPERARGEREKREGARAEQAPASDEARTNAPRREPLSRQEAEALLDALRAQERHLPLSGRERPGAEKDDDAKDW